MASEARSHRLESPPEPPRRLWVPLWSAPTRLMHWTAAACIVVLVVTGFSLGRPYFFVREGGPHFVMAWMRFLHLAAAGVLVATGIFRAWMLLAGNRFERWTALVPHTARDLRNMLRQTVYYATIRVDEAPRYLGHNPMQQVSYLGLYAVAAVMVATGFALYGLSDPAGFFGRAFGWVHDVLGGSPHTRLVHHVLTWVFLVFVPVHVYLSLRADVVDDPGLVSSMITGGRWTEVADHEDLSASEIAELGTDDPHALLRRTDGLAAVLGGIVGGLAFGLVQAVATLAQGGSLWPPQEVIGTVLLGREFLTTAATLPGFVLALVGLVGHGLLSVIFGVLIALAVHRLGPAAALAVGLAAGLGLFVVNVAALAATVVGVGTPWGLLPAHLAFGAAAAATYKAAAGRRRA